MVFATTQTIFVLTEAPGVIVGIMAPGIGMNVQQITISATATTTNVPTE